MKVVPLKRFCNGYFLADSLFNICLILVESEFLNLAHCVFEFYSCIGSTAHYM